MKAKIFLSVFVLLMAGFSGPRYSMAANLNMKQSILPVCFVYLDEKGEIEKLWNNISKADNFYVVKFLSSKDKEVNSSSDLFQKYAIKRAEVNFYSYELERQVEIISTEKGIEEVETIV